MDRRNFLKIATGFGAAIISSSPLETLAGTYQLPPPPQTADSQPQNVEEPVKALLGKYEGLVNYKSEGGKFPTTYYSPTDNITVGRGRVDGGLQDFIFDRTDNRNIVLVIFKKDTSQSAETSLEVRLVRGDDSYQGPKLQIYNGLKNNKPNTFARATEMFNAPPNTRVGETTIESLDATTQNSLYERHNQAIRRVLPILEQYISSFYGISNTRPR